MNNSAPKTQPMYKVIKAFPGSPKVGTILDGDNLYVKYQTYSETVGATIFEHSLQMADWPDCFEKVTPNPRFFEPTPGQIGAMEYTGNNFNELHTWYKGINKRTEGGYLGNKIEVSNETDIGDDWYIAEPGDWIIKVGDKFFPLRKDIFNALFV